MHCQKIILLVLLLSTAICAKAQIVINEVMQSNVDCIMDDLNEFPDSWVELFNTADTAVTITDYHLYSQNKSNLYTIPNYTIEAYGHKLIYCDKENTGWHSRFRLESGKGCIVFLTNEADETLDSVYISKKQPAPNIAYGREADGSDAWGYQLHPTPGTANNGGTTTNILPQPMFSIPGQVFTTLEPIAVAISMPKGTPNETEIRYTTNGSEPTKESSLYNDTLLIDRTTTLRVKPFHPQWLSPRSVTESYIFFDRELTLPVVSIVTDTLYWGDPKIGIYTVGPDAGKPNYTNNWHRPINFEFFDAPQTKAALNQLCETRISGGYTRRYDIKSLVINANKRFGTKRLEYEFFPDQRPGMTDYKSILIRNGGNDVNHLYLRDGVIQRSMSSHVDLDWQAWRPTIVYINGEYRGIENIRERSNEDNIYTNYEGLEDITLVENYGTLKCGDNSQWESFRSFYSEPGHDIDEMNEVFDVDEFINLMIMDLYYNNLDFPGNNIIMWRPIANGGRWRFIAKDTDHGIGFNNLPADYKTLHWLYDPEFDSRYKVGNRPYGTAMFIQAMKNLDFRRKYIQRACIYIGDFLSYEVVWALWKEMYKLIEVEYPIYRALYGYDWSRYKSELNFAENWMKNRASHFLTELKEMYNLGNIITLSINKNLTDAQLDSLDVRVCDVPITHAQWEGQFFAGEEITLQLNKIDADSTLWHVEISYNDSTLEESYIAGNDTLALPLTCQQVTLTAVDSIPEPEPEPTPEPEPEFIDIIESSTKVPSKHIVNGVLLIERQNKTYDLRGQQLKD